MIRHRILLVAVVISLSVTSVHWVRSGYQFAVEAPQIDLQSVPLTLGPWQGEDIEIQEETLGVLSAHSFIQRRYTDVIGREISFHAAIWGTPEEVGMAAPHHPEICYPSAKWTIMERRVVDLKAEQLVIPVELIHFQRQSGSIVTAHWYRMGDTYFTSADEARAELLSRWGEKSWPCVEKYLLQVGQSDIDSGWLVLSRFAKELTVIRESNSTAVKATDS